MHKSLRDFKTSSDRRAFIEKEFGINLNSISDSNLSEVSISGKNIENLIGSVQIPLGIAGPISIRNAQRATRKYYVPLATTEGALVASTSRGCKAITESGGASVEIQNVGVSRSPVFKTRGVAHSIEIKKWIEKNYGKITKICEGTSSHLKLNKITSTFSGKNLFLRFSFNSMDAMGMNMATIATEQVIPFIEKETGTKCISISGNYDIDKKPAWLNFIEGRGKMAWADCTIKKSVVKDILKTTPEKIVDLVYRKILVGSAMSGSIGFNAHFANIIAAVFAATGQDLGQIVEGSIGVTSSEVTENGDLYISVFLPSLMVGTVGGGTNLPAQKESLNIIGAKDVLEFSEVIAATVLAGELSLLASLSEGSLAKAHIKLGRKGK